MILQYLEHCIAGPNMPASIALVLVLIYGLMVIIGAFDIDLFDFDLDFDGDADALTSAGFVTLKFLNIGQVPVVIWFGTFGLAWWAASMLLWFLWDLESYSGHWWLITQLILRNIAIGIVLTKLATQPLIRLFERQEQYKPGDLIGEICEITTAATEEFGQARYRTDGAPLLLNVKTDQGELAKGEQARILEFDQQTRIYLITKAHQEESA